MSGFEPLRWLEWAREIQALSQTGFHFAENEFQRGRYQRLTEIAAEIICGYADLGQRQMVNIFNSQLGYATPRVDVRGAVFSEGKILLVRESMDGGWTMPGGWADVGDGPSEAAEREVWEESGFRVKANKVVGIYDANRVGPLEIFHAYKIVFLCDLISGNARPSPETLEVAFFDTGDLPHPLSGERTKVRHIMDSYQAFINPTHKVVFD